VKSSKYVRPLENQKAKGKYQTVTTGGKRSALYIFLFKIGEARRFPFLPFAF